MSMHLVDSYMQRRTGYFAHIKISTLQQAPTAQRLRADWMNSCDVYYSHYVLNHLLERPVYWTKFRVHGPGQFARQEIE